MAQRPIYSIVPGIMGSELLDTKGHYAGNLPVAVCMNPGIDMGERLKITEHLTVGELLGQGLEDQHIPGYGWFIEELARHGDVYTFPHDWRHRVQYHAKHLARGILKVHEDGNGRPIILVGHSMGGLVCKEALNAYEGVKEAVTKFVALAIYTLSWLNQGRGSGLQRIRLGAAQDTHRDI